MKFIRIRYLLIAAVMLAILGGVLIHPAQANVTALVLYTRTCGTVDAYVSYDEYSEGNPPFYAVFTVDLNNNGIFGEAGEPTKYMRVFPGKGQSIYVGAHLTFNPVPEGSTISVTAYEIDSNGVAVSSQLSPVQYVCTHRPAKNPWPPNTGIPNPGVGIVAVITARTLPVYNEPDGYSTLIGGLANGARVNVLAWNTRGDWVQINYRGSIGWIMWETNATLLGPYSNLPPLPNVEGTLTPTPTPGPSPTPTSTPG